MSDAEVSRSLVKERWREREGVCECVGGRGLRKREEERGRERKREREGRLSGLKRNGRLLIGSIEASIRTLRRRRAVQRGGAGCKAKHWHWVD